ncbi:MAG: OB-fold nucleic acid binding domain-containing protein, partial [Solirubrobacteraceae bacterium]
SGSCDGIAGGRRQALWQLGVAPTGELAQEGVQLALPVELPATPSLRALDRWQRVLADYATSDVSAHDHAMAALRARLRVPMLTTSAQLARKPHGCSVTVAGLVIARQRPGTAKGTMFLLFEDEWGVVNLIVPKAVYEARRALARAEPLLLARGRLERHDGVTNVIVREIEPLERFLVAPDTHEGAANVSRLPSAERPPVGADEGAERESGEQQGEEDAGRMAASMRAVAPPVQSFASRRR